MQAGWYHAKDYNILGDGITNHTRALNALLQKIAACGGGTLYLSPGEYVTGTLELGSHTTLWLENGARLLGSAERSDFPLIGEKDFPGWGPQTHAPLLFARNANHVAVRGQGIIDARGAFWWRQAGEERPKSLEFIGCTDVLVEDVTFQNSPMWTLHPLRCDRVVIRGVTIRNPQDSPNTDGINPESCRNVRISDCHIEVGDDCVTLKSGRQDQPFHSGMPCENIAIINCTMRSGHGGVVIGSEMSGGVRNVVISNCVFQGTDRGIRIKTRRFRGGAVENVRISNVVMEQVWCPLVINCFYRCGTADSELEAASSILPQPVDSLTPAIRRIALTNILVTGASASACRVRGLPEQPVEDLSLDQVTVYMDQNGEPRVPVMDYWERPVRGEGMQLENVRGLTMRSVAVFGCDSGTAFSLHHITGNVLLRDLQDDDGMATAQSADAGRFA